MTKALVVPFIIAVTLTLVNCAHTKDQPTLPVQQGLEDISLEEIGDSLDLDLKDLGFAEKMFNSCSLDREIRGDGPCGTRYFSVVHFRVQCRDTTGTTESTVTSLQLRALSKRQLEWVVGPNRGVTMTDGDGYGKARVLSKASIKDKRFVLKANKTALGLTTEEVSRIVVPSNWCG